MYYQGSIDTLWALKDMFTVDDFRNLCNEVIAKQASTKFL